VALVCGTPAGAQVLGFKPPPPQNDIWIVGATIHPVSGPAIEGGAVQLRTDGTIGEVRAPGQPLEDALKQRATIIDATGKHVYPGLFGASTQMGLTEIDLARATRDFAETGTVTPEVRAAVAVNPDSTLMPVARLNGVLSCGVMPLGGSIPGRAAVISLDGWTWENMAVDADVGMVVNWPNMRTSRAWWVTKTEEEQKKDRAEALDRIDQAFAGARAYLKARASDPSVPVDLRWEAMRGVLEQNDPVIIRAEELEQIQSSVVWAIDNGMKPIILGGRDAHLATDLLKQHDVPVILAGTFRVPGREDADYDAAFKQPLLLEQAGVRWCLANVNDPGETSNERNLPYQAALAAAYGLPPDVALRGITLSPAQILGVGARLGSIETGKDATIIITSGDPLEITTKVERAFIRSREVELRSKQTDLEKKYREKYRQLGITPATSTAADPAPAKGSGGSGN
jgi:imidazolonepropionase-like amidohydrolase